MTPHPRTHHPTRRQPTRRQPGHRRPGPSRRAQRPLTTQAPLRVRVWQRVRVWLRRMWFSLIGGVLATLLRARVAVAAPMTQVPMDSSPPMFTWMQLIDSKNVSVWSYQLSLDEGGVTSPGKAIWSTLTEMEWNAYRTTTSIGLWFMQWAMQMSWLDMICKPFLSMGDSIHQMMTSVGLAPVLLTTAAAACALWFIRGRIATAVWELLMACVIITLSSGALAQPVQMMAGSNGYIAKAGQAGQEIAAAMNGDANTTAQQAQNTQSKMMVDTFIREPTQIVNFGRVVDKDKCAATYDKALKTAKDHNDLRNAVGDCDSAMGDYASNPGVGMTTSAFLLAPAGWMVIAMGMLLAGSMVASVVWALYLAVKLIVQLILGILPGSSRGGLFLTVAEAIMSLAIIIFTNVFLAGYEMVIQNLFTTIDNPGEAFVLVDIFMAVGGFVYWRNRKRIKDSAHRLAQLMSARPGASPSQVPAPSSVNVMQRAGSAIRTVASVAQLKQNHDIEEHGLGNTLNAQQNNIFLFGNRSPAQNAPRSYMQQMPDPEPGPAGTAGVLLGGGQPRPAVSAAARMSQLSAPRRPRGELPPGPSAPGSSSGGGPAGTPPQSPAGPQTPSSPAGGTQVPGAGRRGLRWAAQKVTAVAARSAAAAASGGSSEAAARVAGAASIARRTKLVGRLNQARSAARTARTTANGGSVNGAGARVKAQPSPATGARRALAATSSPRPTGSSARANSPQPEQQVLTGRVLDPVAPTGSRPGPAPAAPSRPAAPTTQAPSRDQSRPAPTPRATSRPTPPTTGQTSAATQRLRQRLANPGARQDPRGARKAS